MKKGILLVLALSFLMMSAACGTTPDNTPSDNNSDDKPSAAVTDSTLSNDTSTSGNSVTDDFLKTITAETAEVKGVCGADLTWYYQDNVLVIKGTGKMNDAKYTYDEELHGNVSNIWVDKEGNSLYDRISWVIIDEGATSIGVSAFANFVMISNVTVPKTMEEISGSAFQKDRAGNLRSVTFLGDAPIGAEGVIYCMEDGGTVYYSGSGFDNLIEKYTEINWLKQ